MNSSKFYSSRSALQIALSVLLVYALAVSSGLARADEIASLKQQVIELENRVLKLEKLLDERFADDRWRDPILWSRIKPGMSHEDVRKLLGKHVRIE